MHNVSPPVHKKLYQIFRVVFKFDIDSPVSYVYTYMVSGVQAKARGWRCVEAAAGPLPPPQLPGEDQRLSPGGHSARLLATHLQVTSETRKLI